MTWVRKLRGGFYLMPDPCSSFLARLVRLLFQHASDRSPVWGNSLDICWGFLPAQELSKCWLGCGVGREKQAVITCSPPQTSVCVHLHVCMYAHVYVYTHIYVCTCATVPVYMVYVSLCVHVCPQACVYACVVGVCIDVCLSMCVHVSMCVQVLTPMRECVSVTVAGRLCAYVYMHVHASLWGVYVCDCAHTGGCLRALCECVFLNMCV